MLYKKTEEFADGHFYKSYVSSEKVDVFDVIENVQNSGYLISKIKVTEDADSGMKTFHGYYSLEKFNLLYPKINKQEIEQIILYLNNNSSIYLNELTPYIGFYSDVDEEIDNYISGKEKRESL